MDTRGTTPRQSVPLARGRNNLGTRFVDFGDEMRKRGANVDRENGNPGDHRLHDDTNRTSRKPPRSRHLQPDTRFPFTGAPIHEYARRSQDQEALQPRTTQSQPSQQLT